MRRDWQEINGLCLSCHSWQERQESMITAMTTAIILLAIALVAAQGLGRLVAMIATDGLGYRADSELPRSHPHYDLIDV